MMAGQVANQVAKHTNKHKHKHKHKHTDAPSYKAVEHSSLNQIWEVRMRGWDGTTETEKSEWAEAANPRSTSTHASRLAAAIRSASTHMEENNSDSAR